MPGGGGGKGNDGPNDMQVSGAEAAYSTEKGISTYADTRVSTSSFNQDDDYSSQDNEEQSVRDLTLGPDTSTVGMASDLGMTQTQLDKATAKNIVDLVDSGVNVNDAISGKTSIERVLQGKGPISFRAIGEILTPFANAANTKRRSSWIEGTDKFGMPRARDFYIQHKRAYNPNAVLVKGTPEYEFLEDSGYFKSLETPQGRPDNDDNTYYDVPEDVKLVESTAANRMDSVAAKFFGKSANKFKFDFQSEYTKALANQKKLLNKPSAVGLLAVNQSPFYNWLKDNSLDKGIL